MKQAQLAQLENIRVVVVESNPGSRKSLHKALSQAGMKNVLATGDLDQLHRVIAANRVDLIIGSTGACEGKFNSTIHQLRHRNIGENPFVVVISLIDDPTAPTVRAAMDAGPDHLLAKPIDFKVLMGQVLELTHSRKRFVVTADYIGPERRAKHRPGTQRIEQIEVPNPLRQRMTGQMRESTMQRAIDAVWRQVNEQKVERHAFQISWLLDHIVPMVGANTTHTAEFEKLAKRLIMIAKDMSKRIKNTRNSHIREMTMTLVGLSEQAYQNAYPPEDLRLLIKLSEIISESFNPTHDMPDLSQGQKAGSNTAASAKMSAGAIC